LAIPRNVPKGARVAALHHFSGPPFAIARALLLFSNT